MSGFISEDGNYGVFPFGKQWMVIYKNEQLEVLKTQAQCKKFIASHQDSLKTVPENKTLSKKSPRIKSGVKATPKKPTKKK